ncbi:MAG TPA: aminotransferase class I/II-fold pyridoxal phosphate-dependent enzyme, partial [Burkholderiales bacterium]
MNPNLEKLQPYPFQKLATLLAGAKANGALRPISLSIGEPKHPTPQFILDALSENLGGLASYPATLGSEALRTAIAGWLERRHGLPPLDPARQVLPVLGSREALFAFAQTVVDASAGKPVVVAPNPFYQIYEGAALLAGAEPQFLNTLADNDFAMDFRQLPESVWQRTQLAFVCSPANPTGAVMSMAEWEQLFALSDRHNFIIAADECYSEIYFDEKHPPLGGLQAAH